MNEKINFRIMPQGYGKASKEVRDYITNLQQENERLNEICIWKQEHEKELHTRIDKAIEYIENAGLSNYEKELYNILQGSDKE